MILPISMSLIVSTTFRAVYRTRAVRVGGYLVLVAAASSVAQILIGSGLRW